MEIEKLWILFQIFKSLEICHATDIIHGDVKPENIMCTTANWVVLTDFAPFKPVMLPNDDPTGKLLCFLWEGDWRCTQCFLL